MELIDILEKMLTNALSNLFLLTNSASKEHYYSDKYLSLWKGSQQIHSIKKIPIKIKKLFMTEDTIYVQLSLGFDDCHPKKLQVFSSKYEKTTILCELEYKGIIANILPAIQNFYEKNLVETLLEYHKKIKPIFVDGEKLKNEFENLFTSELSKFEEILSSENIEEKLKEIMNNENLESQLKEVVEEKPNEGGDTHEQQN